MSINSVNNIADSKNHCYVRAVQNPHIDPQDLRNLRPVVTNPYQRDTSLIFTPELSRAITDRCRAIFNLNQKEKFIKGTTTISDLYKKVEGLTKLEAYISTDTVLSKIKKKISYTPVIKTTYEEGLPIDFDFSIRRKALENLSKFGASKENDELFKIIGQRALDSIVYFNEDLVKDFDDFSVENMRKLLKHKSLAPIRNKFKDEYFPVFMKKDASSQHVRRNIDILADLLEKPEYKFLKKNKSLSASILFYKGNTEKALNILKDFNSSLKPGEKLRFFFKSGTGNFKVQLRNEYKGGLKLAKDFSYDKNLNIISKENIMVGISSKGKKTKNTFMTDVKRNVDYQIREVYDPKYKSWVITDRTAKYKDTSGKVFKIDVWKMSDVDGVYNIKSIDAKGRIKTISSALKNGDGIIIEKNLTSPIGDTTTVKQFKSKNGTKETFSYIIKDKNGKILAQRESLFKKISSTKAFSIVDGEKYLIEYLNDKINVLNEKTKELKSINLKDIGKNCNKGLLNLLKRLSAPELIDVGLNIKEISSTMGKNSSYMVGVDKIACSANRYVFDHELGHAVDGLKEDFKSIVNSGEKSIDSAETKIASDPKLQKIFNAEKKMFIKSYDKKLVSKVDYFLSDNVFRKPIEGLREAVAEVYAIKNNQIAPKWLMSRSHLLQENFQRTIAYLIKHKF